MKTPTYLAALRPAALIVVGTLALTTACSSTPTRQPDTPPATDGVVIVTNSRANVPVPRLSPANAALIAQVLRHGLPVTVVSADGTPELVPIRIPQVSGNNEPAYDRSLEKALRTVQLAITALPDGDGAAAYGALAVARDSARALSLARPTIICLQCGLDTQGPLDMSAEGAVRADPQDFVQHLETTRQLVRFDGFTDATVVLTSVGQTASPQQPLIATDRENLIAIWRAVIEAGGAKVVEDPQPAGGGSVTTSFRVPVIKVPAPTAIRFKFCQPQSVHFDGASSARFVADTDRWIDREAAREALRPLAEWLRQSPRRTAVIQGTTADIRSGRPDEGKALSLERAIAARDLLVGLGVPGRQIVKVEGLGPNYPGKVKDRDSRGNPIPSQRVKNRKVIVTLHDAC